MTEPVRLSPREVKGKVDSGSYLVCAYEDDERCRNLQLEGALTLNELRSQLPDLHKDAGIILYCA